MSFQQFLEIGNYWESFIATELLANRCPIWYPRQTEKECQGNYRANQIDLATFIDGSWQALEVKSRSETFSSIEEYPYPLVAIGSVERWDVIKFKVFAVIVVSQATGAWGCINYAKTRPYWQKRQLNELAYCIPRALFKPPDALIRRLSSQVQSLPSLTRQE